MPGKRITNSSPPCRPSIAERRPINSSSTSARFLRARSPALCPYLSLRRRKASISHMSAETGCSKRRVSSRASAATASNPNRFSNPVSSSMLAEPTTCSCSSSIRVSVCLMRITMIKLIRIVGAAEIDKMICQSSPAVMLMHAALTRKAIASDVRKADTTIAETISVVIEPNCADTPRPRLVQSNHRHDFLYARAMICFRSPTEGVLEAARGGWLNQMRRIVSKCSLAGSAQPAAFINRRRSEWPRTHAASETN